MRVKALKNIKIWAGLSILLASGCAAPPSFDFEGLFSITEKRAPEIGISDQYYEWDSKKSHATNLFRIAGGEYGLSDSFNADKAQVTASTGKRVGSAALGILGGHGLLQALAFDRVLVENEKDAQFNPYILLFVEETELNQGLVEQGTVEFLRSLIEQKMQQALDEEFEKTQVEVLVFNKAASEFMEENGNRLSIQPESDFVIQVSGEACEQAEKNGDVRLHKREYSEQDKQNVSVYTLSGMVNSNLCEVYVSVNSLGWQNLPWQENNQKTHAFKVDTSQSSLSTALATWLPYIAATEYFSWVTGTRWYAGTRYTYVKFPFVIGGGHAWKFSVKNESIPLDEFKKITQRPKK